MNHWMSGLNMLQDHLSEMATWDEMAQGRGLGGSNGAYFALVESKYAVDLLFHLEMPFFEAILRETACCFREAFENSTFIFHRNHVGQQSQDLPNHHNAKACSGNPGLLPELSPIGCMLNGYVILM